MVCAKLQHNFLHHLYFRMGNLDNAFEKVNFSQIPDPWIPNFGRLLLKIIFRGNSSIFLMLFLEVCGMLEMKKEILVTRFLKSAFPHHTN